MPLPVPTHRDPDIRALQQSADRLQNNLSAIIADLKAGRPLDGTEVDAAGRNLRALEGLLNVLPVSRVVQFEG